MQSSFRTFSQNISHSLGLASSAEERHSVARSALESISDSVFPALERYATEKGGESNDYRRAVEEVLQLVALTGIPFVRNCTSFAGSVAFLDQMMEKCPDPQIRKKLATYSNQLKQNWNRVEPGGIGHAPRARKAKSAASDNPLIVPIASFLCAAFLLFSFFHLANLSGAKRQPPVEPPVEGAPAAPPVVGAPSPEATAQAGGGGGDFYRYNDDENVIHIVNDKTKIPERFRNKAEMVASGTPASETANETPVECTGNRVLVPVTLKYRGREVRTVLLLDTGATVTSISEQLAERLGVERSTSKSGMATVADGRKVTTYHFAADTVSVGQRDLSGSEVAVLPGSGGNGAEGLLGMNFLKEFRYHIDFKRGVIQWGD